MYFKAVESERHLSCLQKCKGDESSSVLQPQQYPPEPIPAFLKIRFSGKVKNKTMHWPAEEKESCLQNELFQDMHRHVQKDLEPSVSNKSLNEML